MTELLFGANTRKLPEIRFTAKDPAADAAKETNPRFSGSVERVRLTMENGALIALAGIGNASSATGNTLRRAAAAAARKLAGEGVRAMAIDTGAYAMWAGEITEGALLGAYSYRRFKTKNDVSTSLETLLVNGLDAAEETRARQGAMLGDIVNRVRDNTNTPPNHMAPANVAEVAENTLRLTGATMTAMDEEELKEKGFGGLLAVGGGSANPPRLVLLERQVDPKWPTVAIVGKTITFDSGGLSIKPAKGMEEEKWDKSGGMAALGILEAITALQIPVNAVALLCAAENMPGAAACRPSDVITIYGGTTVEIIDTDAEGRLVLADGMAYVAEKFKPDLLIDLATLTGAVVIALGDDRSGLFTSDDDLAEVFHAAGETTGDRCWRLPLGEEFSADLDSTVADLKNIGATRNGGASKAAAFLEHFKGDARWVHLDIANTAMPEHDTPTMERGATGAGVRLVVEALRRLYPAR
jgi:leucyl aminopeptidase